MSHKLVVSYSRANNKLKDWLVMVLKSWGVAVWDDQGRINVGDGPWKEQIVTAIGESEVLAVVWTKEFAQSDICHFEFMTALGYGTIVLPLWFEECEIPSRFGGIKPLHRVNYYNRRRHENHQELLNQLNRVGIIRQHVDIIRTPDPPLPTVAVTPNPDDFDPEKYLRGLRDEHSHIDIRGLQVESGQALRFTIEDLYIPLKMAGGAGPRTDFQFVPGDEQEDALDGRVENPSSSERIELDEALQHRRLVIIGDPGAGKTTFLRRIAFLLCDSLLGINPNAATQRLGLRDNPLPLFIRVGELCEHIINRRKQQQGPMRDNAVEWLVDFLDTASIEDRWGLGKKFFDDRLADGTAMVLLDGLDEAPDDRLRRQVSAIVQNACKAFGRCRFVVTTRPRAYEGEVTLPNFAEVQIEHLEDDAIQRFLQRWCQALFPDSPRQADRHHRELFDALHAKPEIRRIARNPVMLTALAVVHWNEKRIPEQRADLYESIIKWLSRSRQQRAGRPSAERCVNLLQNLALAMQDHPHGRQIQIPRREAAESIAAAWRESPEHQRVAHAEAFLRQEELDSGIIVARSDHVRFWHLTFQEFLAARALAARPDAVQSETLFRHPDKLFQAEWRETVLLLGGILYHNGVDRVDRMLTEVLNGLVAARKDKKIKLPDAARCAGLLGAVVQDLTTYKFQPRDPRYHKLFDKVMGIFDADKSQSISITTRIEAADALGRAGDPRFAARARQDNWITIPAGKFLMKSTGNEVELDEFRIGRYPVTVGEFAEFVDDGGYADERWWSAGCFGEWTQPKKWDEQLQTPTRPVIFVSWFEACAYADWSSSHLPRQAKRRLLTEAEWERAAGGTQGREFPWGLESPDESRLNFDQNVGHVTPVGLYPQGETPDGIHEMAGNVWEWCVDWYHEKPPAGRNPVATEQADERVLRGGDFDRGAWLCRSSDRFHNQPGDRSSSIGFRLAAVQSAELKQASSGA